MTDDANTLLSHVPADGSTIGNMKLREILGWDEERYFAARQTLLEKGILATGRGRGGAVMRNGQASSSPSAGPSATPTAPVLEMFSEVEVASPAPVKAAAPKREKTAAQASGPAVTNYQYPTASRKNIPPAGLATKNTVQETNPHLLAYNRETWHEIPALSVRLRLDRKRAGDSSFFASRVSC